MPKAIRVRIVERFSNYDKYAGYMYSLKIENIQSRISRINKKWGDGWTVVVVEGPEDIDVTDTMHGNLGRNPTTSIWSPSGKSGGDLTK